MGMDRQRRVLILIPVFNDWDSLALLLTSLDAACHSMNWMAQVLVVNDASTVPAPTALGSTVARLHRIDILHLLRNLGHQRAIAVGLVYVFEHIPCDAIVIMDGDGEDRPEDVPMLLAGYEKEKEPKITFASRRKRLESLRFRFFYHSYRVLHLLLTGIPVRVGNFSAVPQSALSTLVVMSELWNHYSAAVFRSGLPYHSIPIARGRRLIGKSKMNFPALLAHGLSAISVFNDIVGARLLVLSMLLTALVMALIVTVVVLRMVTGLAIPGWATYTIGFLLVILAQVLTISFLLALSVVGARGGSGFIPLRDGPQFIKRLQRQFPQSHD